MKTILTIQEIKQKFNIPEDTELVIEGSVQSQPDLPNVTTLKTKIVNNWIERSNLHEVPCVKRIRDLRKITNFSLKNARELEVYILHHDNDVTTIEQKLLSLSYTGTTDYFWTSLDRT